MTTNTFYRLTEDGRVFHVKEQVTEQFLSTQKLESQLPERLGLAYNVVPPGLVHDGDNISSVSIKASSRSNGATWWFLQLAKLRLNTTWRTTDGGDIHPVMQTRGAPTLPVMAVDWLVPPTMTLLHIIEVAPIGASYITNKEYLVAIDGNGVHYILPLGNIYADGRLCTGVDPYRWATQLECVRESYRIIHASVWNADLHSSDNSSRIAAMFKFTQLDGTTQQAVVDDFDWRPLCIKTVAPVNLEGFRPSRLIEPKQ
ncbi:MAG TPA: hypothetical protein PKJ00_03355 [Verrucomicrobiota bacterium]|nr:hypothetical protein [Verrucomicrobiota bacterium]HNS69016.1 hypothetical protein [Verrucomicrobiota bacterium]